MAKSTEAEFKDLKKQMADAKKTVQNTAKRLFTEMSADLFKQHPSLISFTWDQYTPYWNDGDTCTFSANTEYPTIRIKNLVTFSSIFSVSFSYSLTSPSSSTSSSSTNSTSPKFTLLLTMPSSVLSNFEDEDLEVMFGDHMEITVHANGKVDTETYDHE